MRSLTIAALLLGLLAATARATERPMTEVDAMAGKALYQRWCSGCHGERGDGAGPAAGFLDPRPRDFTRKVFKFRTTPSGQPPATADVLRVIERGVPGTAMPPFTFLSEADRKKIEEMPDPAPLVDFATAVKTRKEAGGNPEAAHRAAAVLHLANIAIRVGRKLRFDPVKEEIIGDEEANRLVNPPMRAPWHL